MYYLRYLYRDFFFWWDGINFISDPHQAVMYKTLEEAQIVQDELADVWGNSIAVLKVRGLN